MTYVGQTSTTPFGAILAGIIAATTAIIEITRRIIDSIKSSKSENNNQKMIESKPIDLYYNPLTDSYQYKAYPNTMNCVNAIDTNNYYGGMNHMNNFTYDVYQSLQNPDAPVASNIRRYMPNDFGYDTNKRDYLWTNKTLGQVPSTSEYTPYSQRTMFDPVPFMRQSSSYVNDVYYPYSNEDMTYDFGIPKINEDYTKDPYAGIIYRNLENRWDRRQYNPYEPTRPFATYDPRSIDARNPDHNPFGWSQDFINGMVNRTNYYKDLILNVADNPFGVPNDADNPYKTMGGPSYVGPDGKLYIRPMPDGPKEHLTRNFLRRDVPWPTKGPEWFGWNPYGIQTSVFNPDGTPNYYNTTNNGGVNVMSETRRNQIGPNDYMAPNLGDNPYVAQYWKQQEEKRHSYTNPMVNSMANESINSKTYVIQPDPNKVDPNMFANPYSNDVQNIIDRSRLVINPAMGMDFNNGSPNDPNAKLNMLLNMTPGQANAIANGAPVPQPTYQPQQNVPMYQQYQTTPAYAPYQTYAQPQQYQPQSCLGPNVYAGIPGNDIVMRQKVNAYNQMNGYSQYPAYGQNNQYSNPNYGMPQQQQPTYQPYTYQQYQQSCANYGMNPNGNANYGNATYGMNPNAQYTGRPSVFVDNARRDNSNYCASYGMNPNANYGMPPQQSQSQGYPSNPSTNVNYGEMSPTEIFNDAMGDDGSFHQTIGSVDPVTAAADKDCADMNKMMSQVFQAIQTGETPVDWTVNEPENPVSAREANKAIFGIDYGSNE